MVFLLTGPKHSGKSSKAASLVERAVSQGLKVGGILAPSRYANGVLLGFDVVNVQTGDRTILSAARSGTGKDKRFQFTDAGECFGRDALHPENLKRCDLVVVDEWGPFEAEGRGWRKEVDLLVKLGIAPVLLVVREEIRGKVQEIYSIPQDHVFTLQDQVDFLSITRKAVGGG